MGDMHGRAIHRVAQLFVCLLLLGALSIAAAAKSGAAYSEVLWSSDAEVAQSVSRHAQAAHHVASTFERSEHSSSTHENNHQSPCGHGNCPCCCASCVVGAPLSIFPFDDFSGVEAAFNAKVRPLAQSDFLKIWLAFLPFRPPCVHA